MIMLTNILQKNADYYKELLCLILFGSFLFVLGQLTDVISLSSVRLEVYKQTKNIITLKNFYSVFFMAMVDTQYRFMWASCGYPVISHDAIIFQRTDLYQEIAENSIIPLIGQKENGVEIHPLVLGDSAFRFSTWLMKLYINAVVSTEQGYFNYRQSGARIEVE